MQGFLRGYSAAKRERDASQAKYLQVGELFWVITEILQKPESVELVANLLEDLGAVPSLVETPLPVDLRDAAQALCDIADTCRDEPKRGDLRQVLLQQADSLLQLRQGSAADREFQEEHSMRRTASPNADAAAAVVSSRSIKTAAPGTGSPPSRSPSRSCCSERGLQGESSPRAGRTVTMNSHSMVMNPSKSSVARSLPVEEEDITVNVGVAVPLIPEASEGSVLRRLFLLFDDTSRSLLGRAITVVLTITLLVSIGAFVLESEPRFRERPRECEELLAANLPATVEACEPQPNEIFYVVEAICVAIFTVDYLARVLSVHAGSSSVSERVYTCLEYMRQPLNIVDLLAIIPFYLQLALGDVSLGALKVLRQGRVLRLLKMAKHHDGLQLFGKVLLMSGQPLLILVFFNASLVLTFGSLIYYMEGQSYSVDPQFLEENSTSTSVGLYVREGLSGSLERTPFRSIPTGVWWVCTTLTTVGYGDLYPTTTFGKGLAVTLFYIGILFLAMPIGILGVNFESMYKQYALEKRIAAIHKERTRTKHPTVNSQGRAFPPTPAAVGYEDAPILPRRPGLRKKIFLVLEQPSESKLGQIISAMLMSAILVVTVCMVMESLPEWNETPEECDVDAPTVEDCEPRPHELLPEIEMFCIILFTIDFLGRVLTVHATSPEENGVAYDPNRCCPALRVTGLYCLQWLSIIDILSILPFYVQLAFTSNMGSSIAVLRVLRLVRILRVLHLRKLSAGITMFKNVILDSLPAMFILFFMTILACIFFASCIAFAEGSWYSVDHFKAEYPRGVYIRPTIDGYDVEISPFRSIFQSFWWFFTTASTVGYGEYFPTTTSGRIIGIIAMYTGIILLALPISVVGTSFGKFYQDWVDEIQSGQDASKSDLPQAQPSSIRGGAHISFGKGLSKETPGGMHTSVQ